MAAGFTRFNDAHQRHALNGPTPATLLTAQSESAQHLARSALAIVGALNAQPMYHSPAIHAVYARVRQLAHLASDAADRLLDAVDILDLTRAGLPVELGDGFLAVVTEQEARRGAGRCFSLVASLTALGASDALATAELFVAERRLRGFVPEYRPPVLSHTQDSALRAVARGDVAITGGKPYLRREDLRVSISTIRALESRGLVMREDCPDWFRDERVHLTAAGRRDLAACFARHRSTPPAAARPPARPAATAARAAAR